MKTYILLLLLLPAGCRAPAPVPRLSAPPPLPPVPMLRSAPPLARPAIPSVTTNAPAAPARVITVIFITSISPLETSNVLESAPSPAGPWKPVAWFPADGSTARYTVTNDFKTSAFFRAASVINIP